MTGKILHGPKSDFRINPKGIGWDLFEAMKTHSEKTAQIDTETGAKDTYGFLLERCVRTAIEMRKRGIRANDVVTIISYNNFNTVVPLTAGFFLHSIVSTLDPSMSKGDIKYLLNQVKPKMIFIDESAEHIVDYALKDVNFKTEVISFDQSEKHEQFINFLKTCPEEEDTFEPVPCKNLRDTIIILFTSGTTGLPKGICLHHYGMMGQGNFFPLNGAIFLNFASLYWISAVGMYRNAVVSGCPRIVAPKFDLKTVWNIFRTFKPNIIFIPPYHIMEMTKNGIPTDYDTSTIKLLFIGGGSVKKEQVIRLRKLFPNSYVFQGYGLTEIGGGAVHFDLNNLEHKRMFTTKPECSGTLKENFSYKVVDPETGEILGLNQKGELCLKTDFLLNGYWNMDCSDLWDKDGWFKTGDIAYFDEDLCLFIVDRIKEMFKYRSWHIIPKKLESIIAGHPDVKGVVVIGLPHPEDGERPCAVVILKPNAKTTAEEIRKFADQQLEDREKLRGGVKFVESFPMTSTGKIKRLELKRQILIGHINDSLVIHSL